MNCSVDLIEAYVYGELTPRREAEVEAHLAQCEACASERAWLSMERAAFEDHPYREATPPPVECVLAHEHRDRRLFWLKRGAAGTVVALSIAAGFGLWVSAPRAVDAERTAATTPLVPASPTTPSTVQSAVGAVYDSAEDRCEAYERTSCERRCESACGADSKPREVEPVLWSGGDTCSPWDDD
jgi:anti-sigma factor RsiW